MRAFLYDLLSNDEGLRSLANSPPLVWKTQVMPRQSRTSFVIPKPFLIYGLGNNTNEDLAEDDDHIAHRQFLQIWVHDEGGDYQRIDDIVERLKTIMHLANDLASNVSQIRWLETSAEFANDTYNTIFRYARFQAIVSKGKVSA